MATPEKYEDENDSDAETLHWRDGIPCPMCRAVNVPDNAWFVSYFENATVSCSQCHKPFDLWKWTIEELDRWPAPWVAFRLIGAISSRFTVPLQKERTSPLDLSALPTTAEILHVSVMDHIKSEGPAPHAGLTLGNKFWLDPFPRFLYLYGMTHGRECVAESEAWVSVTWIDTAEEEVSVHHLADAAKLFVAGRFSRMLVSANVAVEAALTPALLAWVRTYCPKDDAEDFLGPRGAPYAHQLKVLTKISGRALGIHAMPGHICNILDDLRRYRNDLVHTGALKHKDRPPPTKAKASEFLTAATFGYEYARYLMKQVGIRTDAGTGDTSSPNEEPIPPEVA